MIETGRPKHIVLFESLMYGALAIGLIDRIGLVVAHQEEARSLAIGLLTVFPLVCWLIWLIARRRKTWPIWLFVLAHDPGNASRHRSNISLLASEDLRLRIRRCHESHPNCDPTNGSRIGLFQELKPMVRRQS